MGCVETTSYNMSDIPNKTDITTYGFNKDIIEPNFKIALNVLIFARKTHSETGNISNRNKNCVTLVEFYYVDKFLDDSTKSQFITGLPDYFKAKYIVNIIYTVKSDLDGNKIGFIHQIYHQKFKQLLTPYDFL